MSGAGIPTVFAQHSPPPRNTCFPAVLHHVAELEDASFMTLLEPRRRQELCYRYEVGPYRHFWGRQDGELWHKFVLEVVAKGGGSGGRHSIPEMGEEAAYQSAVSSAQLATAQWHGDHTPDGAFTVVLLQRRSGRRFAGVEQLAQHIKVRAFVWGCGGVSLAVGYDHWFVQSVVVDVLGIPASGVVVHHLEFEGIPLASQVAHIASSDMFFQLHGAGGINYLWLRPCSILFDYFPFNHFTPHFYGPPAENMGLVYVVVVCSGLVAVFEFGSDVAWYVRYAYGHFYPSTADEMNECFVDDVRRPGRAYTCMNLRHFSCRSCSRRHSTRVKPPFAALASVLELALVRREQCLTERRLGVVPGSIHSGNFARWGGSMMAFELAKEVYNGEALAGAIARERARLLNWTRSRNL